MIDIRLAECNGKGGAGRHNRPVGGSVQSLPPDVRTLDLGAEQVHHCSDKLTGLETIPAVCPNRFIPVPLTFSLRGGWRSKKFIHGTSQRLGYMPPLSIR